MLPDLLRPNLVSKEILDKTIYSHGRIPKPIHYVRDRAAKAIALHVYPCFAYLWAECDIGWRSAHPDNAVQVVGIVYSLLVDNRVELVLERLITKAEQSHKLDGVLRHVKRLNDKRCRCDVMWAQRPHPVPAVTCIDRAQVYSLMQ